MHGPVESGVLADLRRLGVGEPVTALETAALALARLLDDPELDAHTAAGVARELRLTMAAAASAAQAQGGTDEVERLAAGTRETV